MDETFSVLDDNLRLKEASKGFYSVYRQDKVVDIGSVGLAWNFLFFIARGDLT